MTEPRAPDDVEIKNHQPAKPAAPKLDETPKKTAGDHSSQLSAEQQADSVASTRVQSTSEISIANSNKTIARLTWGLLAVAVASCIVSALQWCTLKGQLNAMIEEQRAWIVVDRVDLRSYDSNVPVSFDPKTGQVKLSFQIGNTGKTPARVFVSLKGIALGADWQSAQNEACATKPDFGAGYTVFPDQENPFPYFADAQVVNISNAYTPLIVGCVLYMMQDNQPHRTPFYFTISNELGERPSERGNNVPFVRDSNPIEPKMMSVKDLSMVGKAD